MKLSQSHAYLLVAGCLLGCWTGGRVSAAAAEPAKPANAKAAPKEVVVPKSTFESDPKKGKDPFFPKSVRWNPPPPKVDPVPQPGAPTPQPAPPPPKPVLSKHFELRGLVGTGDRRVVTISSGLNKNYIMGLGESKTAATPDGPAKFKVLRYTSTGVIIKVDGETEEKELTLPAQ